ncbi:hypothetical protein CKM354_000666700 [Cercospora kikuchii]|uniref:N-acetyltransferase domain-containing protein n=1 Tax=Cercospora kikuchii TaxID=84275 RepID=A0A9P3FI22_9PEZI|nr:uncharacterized protein CKM354_000666700 [Cercospora kikuchii]GIZ43439.1 hypothetical protein CKM354_000666700 [Cercospora kikuchii]
MMDFTIAPVNNHQDLADTITLFRIYAQSLGIDLQFQDFDNEMSSMPGKYAPPTGALYLARNNEGQAIGCVGLRPLSIPNHCEMKRLYVDPKGRGMGIGKALAEKVIAEATRLGYEAMVLDTLESMESARALYKSLGFGETEAYYETRLENTHFLKLMLK